MSSALSPMYRRPSGILVAGSWIAVFVPLVSLGLLTAVLFVVGAAAARSRSLTFSAAGYAALTVIAFVALNHSDVIFGLAIMILMLGGTVHAGLVRNRVVSALSSTAPTRHYVPPMPGAPQAGLAADPAVQAALMRRAYRERARQLLATDSSLATELGIGRPDLPRQFDDGGLVDVNNVPESVLVRLPGVTPEMAARITAAARVVSLSSVDDLIVRADVPNGVAENLREYLVFREHC